MRRGGIEGPWAAGERILVLVAGDAMAPAWCAPGRRLAEARDASWTVAHGERTDRAPPPAPAGRCVGEVFKLAEQLGGSTLVLTGDDLPHAVLDDARRNNVTQIVLGKAEDRGWARPFGRDLTHALLKRWGGAALHFITEGASDALPAKAPVRTSGDTAGGRGHRRGRRPGPALLQRQLGRGLYRKRGGERGLGRPAPGALRLRAGGGGLQLPLPAAPLLPGPRAPGGRADLRHLLRGGGGTRGLVRAHPGPSAPQPSARRGGERAPGRQPAAVGRLHPQEAADALAEQTAAASGARAVVLLPTGGELAPAAGHPELPALSTAAMGAARWAFERGEAAGAGTGTLPQAGWTFRPLVGVRGAVGAAGYEASADLASEGDRLVAALLNQGAVAIERADLAADRVESEASRRSDRLRAALLNSISHDLRTPLSTVLGAATTLIDYGPKLRPEVAEDLLQSIREEAERLNRYIGNLLEMTRLEGDALKPRAELTDVREVIAAAIDRLERRMGERVLTRDFPPDLSLVEIDPALLEQVVVNVLENALAYSPPDAPIEVAAYEDRQNVVLSIEDEGKGIPASELQRVFNRFRRIEEPSDRARGERSKGVGLGLSIAKGFVEAMGGRIAAASPIHGDRGTGARGTRILISLPKTVATSHLLL